MGNFTGTGSRSGTWEITRVRVQIALRVREPVRVRGKGTAKRKSAEKGKVNVQERDGNKEG